MVRMARSSRASHSSIDAGGTSAPSRSPFNPRLTFASIDELADNLKAEGRIHQPLLVRPLLGNRYEIVFGQLIDGGEGQARVEGAFAQVGQGDAEDLFGAHGEESFVGVKGQGRRAMRTRSG
jgi:hypothetical protein